MRYALILWTLLASVAWSQELTISHLPYIGRILLAGKNEMYVSLKDLAQTMDMKVVKCKHGFWSGYQPPDQLPDLEFNQVKVGDTVIPSVMLSETREYFVSAEGFCRGVGANVTRSEDGSLAVIRPLRPKSRYIPPEEQNLETVKQVPLPAPARDPKKFFLTQYKSSFNQDAKATNGNCGPTTLAMVALAHRCLPPSIKANNPQGLILWCREQMTGNSLDEDSGTNMREMRIVGYRLGLQSRWVDDMDQLDWELRKGRLVAVSGDVNRVGKWGVYKPTGGHALLVVARESDGYRVNDPGGFYRLPNSRMTREDMTRFFNLGSCFWIEPQGKAAMRSASSYLPATKNSSLSMPSLVNPAFSKVLTAALLWFRT